MKSISNGKFDPEPRDLYRTWQKRPNKALANVLTNEPFTWIEPCAGGGDIIDWISLLKPRSRCVGAWDIEPLRNDITKQNFLDVDLSGHSSFDYAITNPPFSGKMRETCFGILDKCIEHAVIGTWLLLPSDYDCNENFIPYMKHCQKIVAINRIKWFKNSSASESKNCKWYFFTKEITSTYTGVPLNINLTSGADKNILRGIDGSK